MSLQDVYHSSLELINDSEVTALTNLKKGQAWKNHTAYVQVIEVAELAASLFIAQRRPSTQSTIDVVELLNLVKESYDDEELRNLSFQLDVDYEDVRGTTRSDKARELITYLQRRGRLEEMIPICAKERPHLKWPTLNSTLPYIPSLDTAVVLDFTRRPAFPDVARFFDRRNLAANVLLITNKIPYPEYKALPPTQNWEELLRIFDRSLWAFKGTAKHFFISAPGALAFGMGSYWGTVDGARVYHYYDDGLYNFVLNTKLPD